MRTSVENSVRVVLIEDDRKVREGLSLLINGSAGFECVATFANAEEAIARVPRMEVDVVLMDIRLPGMQGTECIRELKRLRPAQQIMMLTVFEDPDHIFESLSAGASGYLLKQTPPAKLLEAIAELKNGGAPMSGQIARRVVERFQATTPGVEKAPALSPRENEVIRLLAKGFLYKEIAEQLQLSVETVRTHIRNIYEKLHVRSRTEAVLKLFGR